MNTLRITSYALVLFFFSAFKPTSACEYAGSNINYVKTQTEKALAKDDLNLIRYYTFKALNAIDKSKKQMDACKCEYASIGIEESAYLLKRATKTSEVSSAKDFLKRALENTESSIDALQVHDEDHIRKKSNKLLAINDNSNDTNFDTSKPKTYQEKIDTSLAKYRKSLNKVVQTVDCADAREFAERIYKTCEQELLKEGLSEPKKYYNLKTQEITAKALEQIDAKCGK